jgi:hypothetical protein
MWHMQQFGHLVECSVFELHKHNLLEGVKSCKLRFCKYWVCEKQQSFKVASHKSKAILDYIHSDVWELVAMSSNRCAYYFVDFIDEFLRNVLFYFMKHKSKVFTTSSKGKRK